MPAPLKRLPVRALVWAGLATAAVTSTLLAWLASLVVDLAAAWVADGQLAAATDAATRLPVPQWLSWLVDPAWVKALQSLARELLRMGGDALPMIGRGIGMLDWLIWGLWSLVMLGLVGAALKVHWIAGESQRALTRHSAPSDTSVSR